MPKPDSGISAEVANKSGIACSAGHTGSWGMVGSSRRKRAYRYCKMCIVARTRKEKYGVSAEQYNEMVAQQSGKCAICGESDGISLCVDHDHKSGAVRALLCRKCNLLVGWLELTDFAKAIDYLKRYSNS